MNRKPERALSKCTDFDLTIENHGAPMLTGAFEYEDGGVQGFGYVVDMAFLVRLMDAVGVGSLSEIKGKSCWVTHTHDSITKVEPLHKADGKPFIVADWQKWINEGGCQVSLQEMRTGKK